MKKYGKLNTENHHDLNVIPQYIGLLIYIEDSIFFFQMPNVTYYLKAEIGSNLEFVIIQK